MENLNGNSLNLSELSDLYLRRGDLAEIAMTLGVSKSLVRKVVKEERHSPVVKNAILDKIEDRKAERDEINRRIAELNR